MVKAEAVVGQGWGWLLECRARDQVFPGTRAWDRKAVRICAPPPPQALGPEDFSYCLVGKLIRTLQGNFLLTASVVFGTVACDTPNSTFSQFSWESGSNQHGLV